MLPPETIDHILGFLQGDHATLRLCARAHPTLSKIVNRHLYAHVTIQIVSFIIWSPGNYHPSDFVKLVRDDPDIATCVRSLRLDLQLTPWHSLFASSHNYRGLDRIMPSLINLDALFLSSSLEAPVLWSDMNQVLRTAFVNCVRLPALTEIGIANIRAFPLSILDQSRSLKKLSLSGVGDFDYDPSASFTCSSLNTLVLHHCSSMEIITSWAETHRLSSLEFKGDLKLLPQLLGACLDTLTTLKVHISYDFRTRHSLLSNVSTSVMPMPFSLAYLPHLEQLVIQSSISFTQQFWVNSTSDDSLELRLSHSCLPAIMQLLDTLPSPPSKLARLLISIELDNSSGNISEVDWSPLRSFRYFDVIPGIELRVFAHKSSPDELLNSLTQNPVFMQLEKYRSFRINAVEELRDLDRS